MKINSGQSKLFKYTIYIYIYIYIYIILLYYYIEENSHLDVNHYIWSTSTYVWLRDWKFDLWDYFWLVVQWSIWIHVLVSVRVYGRFLDKNDISRKKDQFRLNHTHSCAPGRRGDRVSSVSSVNLHGTTFYDWSSSPFYLIYYLNNYHFQAIFLIIKCCLETNLHFYIYKDSVSCYSLCIVVMV